MPLIFQQDINEFAKIGVWELKEPEIFFSGIPCRENIPHSSRRLQHLAGRYLLTVLYPDFPLDKIILSNSGKPILIDHQYYFSISHTTDFVAVIVSLRKNVGIDIERMAPKIKGVMSRILSTYEFELLSIRSNEHDCIAETIMWCIKEAVFKWGSKKKVSFQNDIHIVEIDENTQTSNVFFHGVVPVLLNPRFLLLKSHCLVWVEE